MKNDKRQGLEERFNLAPRDNNVPQNVDTKAEQLNRQKVMRYLRSTPKYENIMQKEREILKVQDVDTSMRSIIDMDPNLRNVVYKKDSGVTEQLIDHSEKLAKRKIIHSAVRKKLGPFKYAALTGKMGIDTFFILFAAVGAFAIPTYFFIKTYKVRNNMKMAKARVNPKGVDELDIDDFSLDFTNMRVDEIRNERLNQAKINSQIEALTKDLYGTRHSS